MMGGMTPPPVPVPAVRLPRTAIAAPRVPLIDAHNHLGRWLSSWVGRDGDWVVEDVGALLEVMDAWRVDAIVNLDGRWGAELEANLDRYDRAHPGRFATFCHVDWSDPAGAPDSLRASAAAGAKGLKVWKDLGLGVRDADGAFVLPDDPRLSDVFEAAGELGLPVLIHTADPVAFWWPLDARNERMDELGAHPEWWYGETGKYPSYERLMEAFVALVAAHPRTTFIGAHVCSAAEDLALVDRWLTDHPNLHLDLSARLGELGRQPRATRSLIEHHPDRILLGTDAFPPSAAVYELHTRFLETPDEHFAYHPDPDDPMPQGRWRISGLALPDPLLRAVCTANARRLIRFAA